jgi:hypothetical protein
MYAGSLWTTRLPPHLRERGLRLRWNDETGFDEAWVEDWCITDRGPVGLGNAGTPFVELGRGRRYADGNPAGFDPRARLGVLDAEGIDTAVLYPGLALSLPAIHDSELAVAMGALTRFLPSERMIWASDFPHSDAKYPGVVDELREHTTDMAPGHAAISSARAPCVSTGSRHDLGSRRAAADASSTARGCRRSAPTSR